MFRRKQTRGLTRSLVSAAAAVTVIAAGLVSGSAGAHAAAAAPTAPEDKIRPELMTRLRSDDTTDFWIRFRERADLSKASGIRNWTQRGTAVAQALQKTAADSQAGVRAELTGKRADYQSFWATNAIRVSGGSLPLAQSLAAHPEVEGLYAPTVYQAPKIEKGKDEREVNALEWGIANINADDVWAQYGVKGAGITVANIDTGVQFDHPALLNSYRGRKADGTFDHNYNWFRAAGNCAAPCDTNGHGTHTMGTMAGLDGSNQIGVAPEVKWIAANGCCPNDAALVSSGEWMLQPKDLNGQNPDAGKRPHIINNSWGTTVPSNDPFMEDVLLAWTASGIFGMWANGNNGSRGCQSSGAPGSRIINYSAGNYDINNTIAPSSSRGSGQAGEIKPNLSAPGTNVRSSIPTNGYGSFTGTSMASPHVAGAVALLWSAAPTLVGDIAATKALLDNSATDKADAQCGGTTDDNNVYGEGRLDALALLNAAPVGTTGTLSGKVTDTATGNPIAGAAVTITGAVEREVSTGADGAYSVLLPAGDYQLKVARFGYQGATGTATVTANQTTVRDFALQATPRVTVSGAITDGSGHGWPLYAKVSVEGPSGVFDYTTPANGRYSFQLPASATYTLTVQPQYPGYRTVTKEVAVGAGNLTHNVAVPIKGGVDCGTAPGYAAGVNGITQSFDGTTVPAGWSVVDDLANGQVWKFDDVGNRGNLTGGSGGFAIVDSDEYGSRGKQDTSLVSPVVDLTGVTAPVVRFNQDYNNNSGETADVDLSIDGGATWTNVLRQTADLRGPRLTEVPIPQAAGKAAVKVRFHYYDAVYEWWWAVDNVLVGEPRCDAVNGGLVVGHVQDANTDAYVNGATVTSDDKPAEKATTTATPADAGLADGFYWMFSSLTGGHPFTAKAGKYVSQTQQVEVETDWATTANHRLAAGRLSITPTGVTATLRMPTGKATKSFTVKNTGGAAVDVTFAEREGTFEILGADGSRTTERQTLDSDGAKEQRLRVPVSFAAHGTRTATVPGVKAGPQVAPWIDVTNYPASVMDNRVVNLNGKVYSIGGGNGAGDTENYVYDPVAKTWSGIADLPAGRSAMAVGVVDGMIVATGGWTATSPDRTTWVYDPADNTWAKKADSPVARAGAGQAVVAGKLYAIGGCTTINCTPMSNSVVRYDLETDTWETLPDYPLSVGFASCGGIGRIVYCTGGNNGTVGVTTGYAYDPGTKAWTAIPNAPRDSWAAAYAVANGKLLVVGGVQSEAISNTGFAYDPASRTWSDLPNANTARYRGGGACGFYKIGGSSGGFTATPDNEALPGLEGCAEQAADVSWMSLDKTSATLAPGQSVTVKVTMTANVDQPGTYTASVGVKQNTPYPVPPVAVTMNVQPPTTWGKLSGTVTGTSCQGATAPLPGATVQVDSWAMSWTFTTDDQGRYAYWMDRRNNPLTLIVAKDGWKPQTRTTKLTTAPTVENFALVPSRC